MNVNSSNYSSMSASANKGISGLMSGMDTESMVEKMLSGTQGKIDKQEQLKQQLKWKQTIYQDVTKSINSFYSKYFDTGFGSTLTNNFAKTSFFDAMISTVKSGDAVKVLGSSSSALTADMRLAVKQLATAAKLESTTAMSRDQKISGKKISDDSLTANFEKKVVFKVDGTELSVNLNNINTEEGIANAFQKALDDNGITGVTAKVFEGRFRLVSDNPATTISVNSLASTSLGLKATGLGYTNTRIIKDTDDNAIGMMLQSGTMEPDAGVSFTVSVDGVAKDIKLNSVADASGNVTMGSVRDAMQAQLKRAFGDYVTVDIEGTGADQRLTLSLDIKDGSGNTENGHEMTITGVDANKVGLTPGSTTLLSGSTKLRDMGVNGDAYAFTINGVKFNFTGDDTVSSMINKINNSGAGVKINYSSLQNTFSLEATSTGAKFGIDASQQKGNLLSVIFGNDKFEAGATAGSAQLTTKTVAGSTGGLPSDYTATSGSLSVNVNGTKHTFTLSPRTDDAGKSLPYSKDEVEARFNLWLVGKFGTTGTADAPVANISYSDGKLSVAEGFTVSFDKTKVDLDKPSDVEEAMKSDLGLAFGFTQKAATNVATGDTDISEIDQLAGLTALKADGTAATKLSEIATLDGQNVQYENGRLTLSGSGTIDFTGNAKMAALFGDSVTLSTGAADPNAIKAGQDALIMINGVETSRSSNSLTIDGVSLELTKESKSTTDPADPTKKIYEETVIGTARDTEKIVEGFKEFVKDYNEMTKKLTDYVGEDPNFRTYKPLTEAQKKDMSDREIELWEEKAKQGLVRSDSNIDGFLTQMRQALYSKPDGSKLALYNIGIETGTWDKKGQLTLDEGALRKALSADPDSVKVLFTDSTEGLSKKITETVERYAKVSSANTGILVALAGAEGFASNKSSNSMYLQIKSIDDKLKDLKIRYEKERQRYWNQFNSMETIMAQYNSQSSYISQQFGSV